MTELKTGDRKDAHLALAASDVDGVKRLPGLTVSGWNIVRCRNVISGD